jgi:internalin A
VPSEGTTENDSVDQDDSSETEAEKPETAEPTTPQAPASPSFDDSKAQQTLSANQQVSLADGTYLIPIQNYKTGLAGTSGMDRMLQTPVTVVVKDGQAQVTISVPDTNTFDMMDKYRLGVSSDLANSDKQGIQNTLATPGNAQKGKQVFTQTIPVNQLKDVVGTAMAINAGQHGVMYQTADMVFDLEKAELQPDVASWMPDQGLRAWVQDALGKEVPVTQLALQRINALDLSFSDVVDLTGLSYAKNLKTLDLSGTSVADIQPLADLSQLTTLSLRLNKADSLPDLAPLTTTGIQSLNLVGNDYGKEPEKIASLAEFDQLEELDLQGNGLTTLPPVTELKHLKMLGLAGNKLTNIDGLAKLTGLTSLKVNSNQLTDLSSIAHLTALEILSAGNNPVNDLTPLANLKQLKQATLSQMGLVDKSLDALKNLTQIERLSIDFNDQLTDLSALADLQQLTYLNFSKSLVADLTPLQKLSHLTELRFQNTQVSDISVLQGLDQLGKLNFLRSKVFDLSPLAHLKLTELNAKNQTITLPTLQYPKQGNQMTQTIFATDIDGRKIPLTFNEGIAATVDGTAVTFKNVTTDGTSYFSWGESGDAFTGTVEQPIAITDQVDMTSREVGLRTLKGDGSDGTSVAANFVQPTAKLATDAQGDGTLTITIKVPTSYGEDSIEFADAKRVTSYKVGNEYMMTFEFDVTKSEIADKIPAKMHVNIPSYGYNHWYDVFFKVVEKLQPSNPDPQDPVEETPAPSNPAKPDADTPDNEGATDDVNTSQYQPVTVTYLRHKNDQAQVQADTISTMRGFWPNVYIKSNDKQTILSIPQTQMVDLMTRVTFNGQKMQYDTKSESWILDITKIAQAFKPNSIWAMQVAYSVGGLDMKHDFFMRVDNVASKTVDKQAQPSGNAVIPTTESAFENGTGTFNPSQPSFGEISPFAVQTGAPVGLSDTVASAVENANIIPNNDSQTSTQQDEASTNDEAEQDVTSTPETKSKQTQKETSATTMQQIALGVAAIAAGIIAGLLFFRKWFV